MFVYNKNNMKGTSYLNWTTPELYTNQIFDTIAKKHQKLQNDLADWCQCYLPNKETVLPNKQIMKSQPCNNKDDTKEPLIVTAISLHSPNISLTQLRNELDFQKDVAKLQRLMQTSPYIYQPPKIINDTNETTADVSQLSGWSMDPIFANNNINPVLTDDELNQNNNAKKTASKKSKKKATPAKTKTAFVSEDPAPNIGAKGTASVPLRSESPHTVVACHGNTHIVFSPPPSVASTLNTSEGHFTMGNRQGGGIQLSDCIYQTNKPIPSTQPNYAPMPQSECQTIQCPLGNVNITAPSVPEINIASANPATGNFITNTPLDRVRLQVDFKLITLNSTTGEPIQPTPLQQPANDNIYENNKVDRTSSVNSRNKMPVKMNVSQMPQPQFNSQTVTDPCSMTEDATTSGRNKGEPCVDTVIRLNDNMFLWTVQGYKSIQQMNIRPWSDSFYLGNPGYRLQAKLEINNEFIGIYVRLVPGMFDDELEWPFEREINFSIVDQTSKGRDLSRVLKPYVNDPDENGIWEKPTSNFEKYPGWGFPNLALKPCIDGHGSFTSPYLRNDRIYLKFNLI